MNTCSSDEMDGTQVLIEGGGLHRLGGSIELDGRVSWFPRDLRGFAPANSYLLTAGTEALLVDPGVTAIESQLIGQLRGLIDRNTVLSVLVTRPAEMDCIANVGAILSSFSVACVYAPLIPMHQRIGLLPRYVALPEEAESSWPAEGIEWNRIKAGEVVAVDRTHGARAIEIIDTPLRMLPAVWLYDEASRTLFTSDVFTHVSQGTREALIVSERDKDSTTVGDVRANLLAKFDFLERSRTSTFCTGIEEIFQRRKIETIAPAFGCILSGRAVVDRHLDLLLTTLAAFETSPAEAVK
jgi:flavorubredoxin